MFGRLGPGRLRLLLSLRLLLCIRPGEAGNGHQHRDRDRLPLHESVLSVVLVSSASPVRQSRSSPDYRCDSREATPEVRFTNTSSSQAGLSRTIRKIADGIPRQSGATTRPKQCSDRRKKAPALPAQITHSSPIAPHCRRRGLQFFLDLFVGQCAASQRVWPDDLLQVFNVFPHRLHFRLVARTDQSDLPRPLPIVKLRRSDAIIGSSAARSPAPTFWPPLGVLHCRFFIREWVACSGNGLQPFLDFIPLHKHAAEEREA